MAALLQVSVPAKLTLLPGMPGFIGDIQGSHLPFRSGPTTEAGPGNVAGVGAIASPIFRVGANSERLKIYCFCCERAILEQTNKRENLGCNLNRIMCLAATLSRASDSVYRRRDVGS
jgi:hypothetical protein